MCNGIKFAMTPGVLSWRTIKGCWISTPLQLHMAAKGASSGVGC